MAASKRAGKGNQRAASATRDQRSGATRRPRRWVVPAAAALLCVIHFALAVSSVRHKSNTYDEIAHLTRGYSYRMMDDFRLGPPHPPLAHYWASLPGNLAEIKFPAQLLKEEHLRDWRRSDMWEVGRQFFYYRSIGNADIIDGLLLKGRAMIALWSVALGLLTFFWARWLFGPGGGLIALALYAFSPTMLAHGRLVTTDLGAALFFMASLTAIGWLLHRVSPLTVLVSAAALTCLFLTKLSAVLIIPVGAVLLLLRLIDGRGLPVKLGGWQWVIRSRVAQLGCFLAVMVFWIGAVWLGIWAAYGFRYEAMAQARPGVDHLYTNSPVPQGKDLWEHVLRDSRNRDITPRFRATIAWLRAHRVFPEAYIYSAAYAKQTARGRVAFLDGRTNQRTPQDPENLRGIPGFFLYAALYKTPLPLFGLLLAAACVPLVHRWKNPAETVDASENAGPRHAQRPEAGKPLSKRVLEARGPDVCGEGVWGWVYATAPLWSFFVIYWIASLGSNLNIGHRHVMPTYPVLFVLCGATAAWWRVRPMVLRVVVGTLLGLFVAASLWVYPNYLAYFNSIAGGPRQGYRHLVDSSLDWGQDLPGLAAYLDRRRAAGEVERVYLSYFGSGANRGLAQKHFGIDAESLPRRVAADATGIYALEPGLYALSATYLQQLYNGLKWSDWNPELEADYQRLKPFYEEFVAAENTPPGRRKWATPQARAALDRFLRLRFARLCAHLRTREPDDWVNYSILIYDLDAAELNAALAENINGDR